MPYQVQVESSGHRFEVEDNEPLLDAALRQGLNFPYGCRSGACRACTAKLISGEAGYADEEFQRNERGSLAAGEILCCQARARSDLVLEVAEVKSAGEVETRKLPCRVERMEPLAHDVMRIFLKLPDNERLQFLAGQYIDFILADGRRRSFSLANAPHNDSLLELHIRHVPGGQFTDHVFNKMREKELLRLEGPLGTFFLREDSDRPIIFMAGGTGFAPIKGIIEHAISENLQRPMHLYWGVRAKPDLYLHHLAQSWANTHEHIRYVPVLSDPRPDDAWEGRTGFVHEVIAHDFADLGGYEIYAGGPPPMINAAKEVFPQQGLVLDHFYSDAFDYQR